MTDDLRRGAQAEGLLQSDAFQEAVEAVRDRIRGEWAQSPFKDVEGREKLWLMSKLLDNLVANLESFVDDGKLAREEMTKIEGQPSPWNLDVFRAVL